MGGRGWVGWGRATADRTSRGGKEDSKIEDWESIKTKMGVGGGWFAFMKMVDLNLPMAVYLLRDDLS